jgi:DHA1 family inner membrane transport protein
LVDQKVNGVLPPVAMWRGIPVPVLALTVCAFCIGTAEFVVMGLLPNIADDLGVSIPLAGQLVTAYAIGVVIGAPILAVVTGNMPRKRVLLSMVAIFIIGNFLSAAAPNYTLLLLTRIIAAFAHGTLFGVGAIVASDMVAPNKKASAIGLMFTGLTLANILGVPFGTFIGQGHGWRVTFILIALLGMVGLIAVAWLVPNIATRPSKGLAHEFKVLRQADVLIAISTTVLLSAATFTLFTYIVPLLQDVTGFAPSDITLILVMIGVGLTIGITLGGKFSDRGAMRAMIIMLAALVVAFALIPLFIHSKTATLVMIFVWSVVVFGTVPGLQSRVVEKAFAAPNFASTLNIGAFNLGNAGGAFLGGMVISFGLGLPAVPVAAAVVTLLAIATAVWGATRDRRSRGQA